MLLAGSCVQCCGHEGGPNGKRASSKGRASWAELHMRLGSAAKRNSKDGGKNACVLWITALAATAMPKVFKL